MAQQRDDALSGFIPLSLMIYINIIGTVHGPPEDGHTKIKVSRFILLPYRTQEEQEVCTVRKY